jgi:O-antigen/teichoic acid export membrane protein
MIMIRTIFNTFFTRSLVAAIGLAVMIITARYLGAALRGEISLFVLNITLVFQVVALVSGGLIYYTPRRPVSSLLISTYIWMIGIIPIISIVLYGLGFLAWEWMIRFMISALFVSTFSSALNIFIGWENIRAFNSYSLLQATVLILVLSFLILYWNERTIYSWFYAYLTSFAVASLWISGHVLMRIPRKDFSFDPNDIVQLFHYGKWGQLANIAQLLNYRLGYYLIEYFQGKASLGIYSVAVLIAESTWLISKSFATVLLSRIVNMKSQTKALVLTLVYARISLYFSIAVIALLLLIPGSWYIYILGNEFFEVKWIIAILTPGIASFALTTMYAHYFSGTGRPKISSYSSLIGLFVTFVLGFWLIPIYGKVGAAITASGSFISSGAFLTFRLLKENGATWKRILPHKNDWINTHKYLQAIIHKSGIDPDLHE